MPHGPAEVGVGPWQGPRPQGEQYDERLLAEGDRRNVVDRYRYWTMEAIVADLDTRRHDFHVAIENWQHDFNIGTIVRSANAFLAAEVHIVGNRRWNRRGAMVTDRYQHVRHHPTVDRLADHLHERGVFVVPDILANAGGVTTSYFEWVQDRHGYFWTEKEVNERLEAKMCQAFNVVLETALKYNVDMRVAAYIVAIGRVATVTKLRGMYA